MNGHPHGLYIGSETRARRIFNASVTTWYLSICLGVVSQLELNVNICRSPELRSGIILEKGAGCEVQPRSGSKLLQSLRHSDLGFGFRSDSERIPAGKCSALLGTDLRAGKLRGHVLTDYGRPTPPSQSGYHRYQFRLYEQPAHEAISLSPEEEASLGSWPLERFVEQFRLGSPVASTQFLTQHHSD
ncbi:hypothetical protein KIL84_011855 [Mauremys mutica]|uniref:Phosphatidylethanolamine-binding protein 4 n=1 Tax=Mauremys mutica TaxID=74926 RepID=A0A9D4B1G5_9SAUR|nr:hypothetical protein KIL84_011855 [Mauremys mutica]